MSYRLPVFLELTNKPVLLVGGGSAALEKLEKLVTCQAKVTIVAEHFHKATRELINQHDFTAHERAFQPTDLEEQRLVISAVNHSATHSFIADQARRRGLLVNTVDEPSSCDLFFAAQIERGPLQLAISTQGLFPGVARAIRLWLEDQFPEDVGYELQGLASLRKQIKPLFPSPKERMQALRVQLQRWMNELPQTSSGESA
jgi:siroheme synthase-like protein